MSLITWLSLLALFAVSAAVVLAAELLVKYFQHRWWHHGMRGLLTDVGAFHRATDTPVLSKPRFPSDERVRLRLDLILEETRELLEATMVEDIVEVSDALADLIYVAVGAALEFGIPLDKVWDEVQRSNMAKVDPETGRVKRRADGKILKPDGWQPPDIAKVLA